MEPKNKQKSRKTRSRSHKSKNKNRHYEKHTEQDYNSGDDPYEKTEELKTKQFSSLDAYLESVISPEDFRKLKNDTEEFLLSELGENASDFLKNQVASQNKIEEDSTPLRSSHSPILHSSLSLEAPTPLLPGRSYKKIGSGKPLPTNLSNPLTSEEKDEEKNADFLSKSKTALPLAIISKEESKERVSTILLDEWQKQAIQALNEGKHVIVDAPTSAGKTRVIEAFIEEHMKRGDLRVVYTTPVKSLSNDKYIEFSQKFGQHQVGINTGDFKENLSAPLVLATLETYRNSLLGTEPDFRRKLVVFDEYHYLQDSSRGSAWEEAIILTPKDSQLLLLSASVPNTQEFSGWIEYLTKRAVAVITVSQRPVALKNLVYMRGHWILADLVKITLTPADATRFSETGRADAWQRSDNPYAPIIPSILSSISLGLHPLIVYTGKRQSAEDLAGEILQRLRSGSVITKKPGVEERVSSIFGWEYVEKNLKRSILDYGIAYHHSGLIPPARIALEVLLKEGYLSVCVATMGISVGVNFAVKSCIVFDTARPGEGGRVSYSNVEMMQMLGRAGRRGKDKVGFSLWPNFARFTLKKPREREACTSSLKIDPSTVLSVLDRTKSIEGLSDFYKKSFFTWGSAQKNKQSIESFTANHDAILSQIMKTGPKDISTNCNDIPKTFYEFTQGSKKSKSPCKKCPAKPICHTICRKIEASPVRAMVTHLRKIKALSGEELLTFGKIARYFPQPGGLLIARWLSTGQLNEETFYDYLQVVACFTSTHFKEIYPVFVDIDFVTSLTLDMDAELSRLYPSSVFPELYEYSRSSGSMVFREFNLAAGSLVNYWVNPNSSWSKLVKHHANARFSEGDCMNILFRFVTYLQSFSRLDEFPEISREASKLIKRILRAPLDARQTFMISQIEEKKDTPKIAETSL